MKLGSFKGIFVYMLIAAAILAVFVTVFSPSFCASRAILNMFLKLLGAFWGWFL